MPRSCYSPAPLLGNQDDSRERKPSPTGEDAFVEFISTLRFGCIGGLITPMKIVLAYLGGLNILVLAVNDD
jgi:hypothetical protein